MAAVTVAPPLLGMPFLKSICTPASPCRQDNTQSTLTWSFRDLGLNVFVVDALHGNVIDVLPSGLYGLRRASPVRRCGSSVNGSFIGSW
jgi:hypothetical protein